MYEARRWSREWQCEAEYIQPQWPNEPAIGELPALTIEDLRDAARTFPPDTGLGWDGVHPRALTRLSDDTLAIRELTGYRSQISRVRLAQLFADNFQRGFPGDFFQFVRFRVLRVRGI